MTIAPKTDPLGSVEPLKVARRVMAGLWGEERGVMGLVMWRGEFWEWRGERWRKVSRQAVEDRVRLGLEDSWFVAGDAIKRYGVNSGKVTEVVDAIEALARKPLEGREDLPVWMGPGECPFDRDRTVAFEDVLVEVSGEGRVMERGREWFDGVVLPGKGVGEAEGCPRWMKALRQWSKGDEKWMGLAKRMVGMWLMAGRHHHRWGLVFGPAGTGKTTFVKVLEWLVGRDAYLSTDVASIAGGFGLDGMQGARLVGIKEVTDLEGKQGDAAAGVMKRLMGEDEVTINAKFERPEKNVKVRAGVLMVSNTMPRLPNRGLGLSQKMLVLPFTEVFRGEDGEELGLEEALKGELEGIARWALEGAREIEREGPKTRWPVPEEAGEVARNFVLQNNPADAFLEARCFRKEGGFVTTELLWREWEEWRRVNQVEMRVARNRLAMFLVEEGTWKLRRHRKEGAGGRGLVGLGLRQEADDRL